MLGLYGLEHAIARSMSFMRVIAKNRSILVARAPDLPLVHENRTSMTY